MTGDAIRVEGLRELQQSLRKLSRDVTTDGFKKANGTVSQLVASGGRASAPARTGRLASSVRPSAAASRAVVRAGGARVPYANAIHWGTGARAGLRGPHNIPRRPWLWETVNRRQSTIEATYFEALEALVKKVHGA